MSAAVIEFTMKNDAGTVLNAFPLPKAVLDAVTAPTVTDDDAAGFARGSYIVDTVGGDIYDCLDNSTGAAVWVARGSGSGGITSINGDTTAAQVIASGDGSLTVDSATTPGTTDIRCPRYGVIVCIAATTGDIDLSTDLENGDTVDGVNVSTGDLVLVRDQTATEDNGVYVVSVSGAASRAAFADSTFGLSGALVFVRQGSTYAGTHWRETLDVATVGTNAVAFEQIAASGGTVTSVSVVTANGVSGSVATATTTPAITLTLGNITPTSVAATGVVSAILTDAGTTNVAKGLRATHNTSGTPAAGFGTSIEFRLQSTTTADTTASEVETVWVDATHASRKARQVYSVYDTAAREVLRLEASGTAAMLGVLGAAAVVRQTGDAGSALVAFGFMSGTPTFAAANLSGGTLAAGVTASSLTSFGASPTFVTPILGTPTSGTLTNCTGTAAGLTAGIATVAAALQTPRNINGVAFDGTANITVTAAAGTLTGATLAAGVTASSLLSAAGGTFGTAAFETWPSDGLAGGTYP